MPQEIAAKPVTEGIRQLDLHHVEVLALLLQECSVSKVAILTGRAQPAISRDLRKLREVIDDPLLVRSGARLVPTERAQALRGPVQEILNQLARLEVDSRFDPGTAAREFQVGFADCVDASLFSVLIERIMKAGPRLSVRMRMIDPSFDAAQALEAGKLDLVISNSPNPREDLRTATLYHDEVVCLMRKDHPAAGHSALSLARYLNLNHLAPFPSASGKLGPIDGELFKAGYRRRLVATVPEFNLVPSVLLDTDLVFTTGRRFAARYAAKLPLVIVGAPMEFPPMRFYQLWHERNHTSASNRWLRLQVGAAASA
jgi:DNA-binding transcriptional LysR family regulator